MSTILLKALLAPLLAGLALIAMFTMFEGLGRKEKRYNFDKLKTAHRWNGYLFLLLFLVLAALGISLLGEGVAAGDARNTFHLIFALTILLLLLVKVLYIRTYRLFYNQVAGFGLTSALLTILLTLITSGYFFIITDNGLPAIAPDNAAANQEANEAIALRTDQESIAGGQELFREHCIFCHNPESRAYRAAGPGLKDLFEREELPSSGRVPTPENIARQLRDPLAAMPSFDWLSQEEVEQVVAYLNTL